MTQTATLAANILDLYLDAAPWLVFGFFFAGLLKAWAPEERMRRWLGGKGFRPVLTAALVGAPLPICSCGVLPAAVALRRVGVSREATVSFMIATPETGVDSVALSYALLGPFLAVARPIAAVASAVATGMLCGLAPEDDAEAAAKVETPPAAACPAAGCGGGAQPGEATGPTPWGRTCSGLRYAFGDILAGIAPWLVLGLVLAGLTTTFVPPQALAAWGGGLPAMGIMLAIGIPMYICATASTPLAASLLIAGLSPGAVMVFLLAGPATNVATLAVVRKEMGNRVAVLYLAGIGLSAVAAGLITDALFAAMALDVSAELSAGAEFIPLPLAWASAAALAVVAARPYGSRLVSAFSRKAAAG